MNRWMQIALAMLLALASGPVAALGLGQIHLKSKLGEPLLAEIPIISSDPSELENLRAGLASPETFARIGLALPQGVVANLTFVPALDAAGRPVIRVTSSVPIEEPLLTFLVEVDWGQGRLVREYSTLLDAPRTVSAPLQPAIDAPTVAPSNVIVREPLPTFTPTDADQADADVAVRDEDAAEVDAPESAPEVPAPAAFAVAERPMARPGHYGAVQQGETLSEIASRLDVGGNLNQRMIALLQANPEAFIGGNIHLLRQGAVLRIPDAGQVGELSASQAAAQVREQTHAWRAASQPVPQPQVAGAEDSTTAGPDSGAAVAGADGARLEIVPPGAGDAARAGTRSGISAGGEGDMVRQELQVTKETLAAREAELTELKSRVDALEQLQADQQQLIEMKNSELAVAEQKLAQSPATDAALSGSMTPWLIGGAGLLLILIGAWWLTRRADAVPRFRAPLPPRPASNLTTGFPQPRAAPEDDRQHANDADEVADGEGQTVLTPAAMSVARAAGAENTIEADAGRSMEAGPVKGDAAAVAVPAWHSGAGASRLETGHLDRQDPVAAKRNESSVGTQAGPAAEAALQADMLQTDTPGQERLELARAYLELGDRDSARQLLAELVVSGDLEARQQAVRLLRELG